MLGHLLFISVSTLYNFESVREIKTTLKPYEANYRQYSAPIPSDAPVTTAQDPAPYFCASVKFEVYICLFKNYHMHKIILASLISPMKYKI